MTRSDKPTVPLANCCVFSNTTKIFLTLDSRF
jgi:hypothetical protein